MAEGLGGLVIHGKLLEKSFLFIKGSEVGSQAFSFPPNHIKGVRLKNKFFPTFIA